MKLSEYNSYPKDMQEMTKKAWDDFFTYCFEEYEFRQAYRRDPMKEMHEKLRIAWINKERNIGFCIGQKEEEVKFYRIGSNEEWDKFKRGFAAQFAHDYS